MYDGLVQIFSREEMIQYLQSCQQFENQVAISITDPDKAHIPRFLFSRLNDTLFVKFWDVEEDTSFYRPIDKDTAKQIAIFIDKHKDKRFLVNCEAGISRSAGVALAIICIIRDNGSKYQFSLNGSEILLNPRFKPNWIVFDRIVNAYKEVRNED